MEISELIKSLDRIELLEGRKLIDNQLAAYDDPKLGGMRISDFIDKLRVENKASSRLIEIMRRLNRSYKYVFQITDEVFRSQPNSGVKTLAEFKEWRGY